MNEKTSQAKVLELEDIQASVLRLRPSPYTAAFFLLRIDDPADGRRMLRRLAPQIPTAANWWDPPEQVWLSVSLTYAGLRALGVRQASLDSFPPEFREGMAARAETLGDVGDSSPEHWDPPLGSTDVHVMLSLSAPDDATMQSVLDRVRKAEADLPGVSVVYRLDTPQLPTGRTHLGFVDGIGEPDIEGTGVANVLQQATVHSEHYGYLPGSGRPGSGGAERRVDDRGAGRPGGPGRSAVACRETLWPRRGRRLAGVGGRGQPRRAMYSWDALNSRFSTMTGGPGLATGTPTKDVTSVSS